LVNAVDFRIVYSVSWTEDEFHDYTMFAKCSCPDNRCWGPDMASCDDYASLTDDNYFASPHHVMVYQNKRDIMSPKWTNWGRYSTPDSNGRISGVFSGWSWSFWIFKNIRSGADSEPEVILKVESPPNGQYHASPLRSFDDEKTGENVPFVLLETGNGGNFKVTVRIELQDGSVKEAYGSSGIA
jgi:hypothetical protein